jgi:hypothetical protein
MVFQCKNLREYIEMQLDLYCLLKRRKPLTKKPKKFFIECIILTLQGRNINSHESFDYLREYMHFDFNDSVYNYRSKLKKSEWLISPNEDVDYLEVRQVFNFSKKRLPNNKTYHFTLQNSND